jgi:hypothetical protein
VLVAAIIRAMIPDDRGSKHLRNVNQLLPDNTAQQSRRQLSYFFLTQNNLSIF